MNFGKLQDISTVDFSMPTEAEFNTKVWKNQAQSAPQIHWGCTGWSMAQWVGDFYPKGTKSKDYLKEYAKQFSTIELNTTHYRIPSLNTIQKWYEESDKAFKFAPKMPQVISHSRDLGIGNDLTNRFCDSIIQLKEKLGVTFMQMPPHFGYDRLPLLSTFLKRFPTKDIPLAIEVRHQEWFANPDYFKALLDLLYEYQVSTVITDVAGRRDVLHLALTTPIALIRFVGNGLHPTDYQRVDDWIDLLKDWTARGLEEFYFFSHQPDNILSPQMCIYFQQQLEEKCGFQFSKKTKKVVDTQMRLF